MLVIFLTLLWIARIVLFVGQLKSLVAYAGQNNLNIFEHSYQNWYGLIGDFSFISKLFSRAAIDTQRDAGLILRLGKLRISLWIIILLGVAIQLFSMLSTATHVAIQP